VQIEEGVSVHNGGSVLNDNYNGYQVYQQRAVSGPEPA
jgi:hypothetical protein